MSSNPSDVLGTVFLWVCFCILTSIAYLSLTGDGEPTEPKIAISHYYIEPQAVLQPPLWSLGLPPPREPPQPTFEPRPEPQPLPRRRNGLIPRAERRVRPAVFPERHAQREHHMTEMSTREKVAAAAKQAAKEARQAQKEQELHWRSKATSREEAKAERKEENASRTGGERKQLGIDLDAARNRPSNAQNIKIERPPYEGSNAFTGTALGDKIGTAYAPPMEIEGADAAAKPLTGEVQQSDNTPADNTSTAPEENAVPNPRLAGEVQEASNIVADHSSTTEEAQSVNPFLEMNDEDAASGLNAELGMLQQAKADFHTDETWNRRVLWVYTSWRKWITCGNTVKWHFDKLNEAQTQYLKPMVDEVFALFEKRCGKRNDDVPADALNETLAVVSEVRDNMNEALGHPEGGDSGQPDIPDQPIRIPSMDDEQTTSDVQLSKDEQFDHIQEQISEDHESAKRLHQELNQDGAQISSDREYAKKVAQEQESDKKQEHQQPQQRQQRKKAPVHRQTYIHGDLVDLQTRTRKQDYPQTTIASGSGTYPKDRKARQEVNVPESPLPWPKLPRYKTVRLASELVVVPSFHAPAGGVQESDHTPAEDATIGLDEKQVNTDQINVPANQLLGLPADQARGMLTLWLSGAESSVRNVTQDKFDAFYQDLRLLSAFWSQWMDCGGDEIWRHVPGCGVVPYATLASDVLSYVQQQRAEVTREMKNVYHWMNAARDFAEKQEQARISEEQEQARINGEARQQSIHMAQILQQQQLAQRLEAEKQEEQARISEEQRQESVRMAQSQQQQQPQIPPIEDDDEDLYGNDARGEASQQAFIAARKMDLANAESVAANKAEPEAAQTTSQKVDTDSAMDEHGQNTQIETVVQQQPPAEAAEPRQQASASSATTQQPSRAPVGVLRSRLNRSSSNTGRGRPNVRRTQLIRAAQKEPNPPPVGEDEDQGTKKRAAIAEWADFRQNALDEHWQDDDIHLEDGVHPLEHGASREASLVLVTTWLQLNNEAVRNFQRQFKRSEYKDTAISEHHGPFFMGKIKLISARYSQLRDYACVKGGKTENYDWNLDKISLDDIKENDLEQLVSKDQEFMLTLNETFLEDETDQSQKLKLDECRNIVLEAYANVMAVARSIRRITSSNDDSDSELSDASSTVKAAMGKDDAKMKASRQN